VSAPTVPAEAQDYLAAVEHELADLPADDRAALLEDLAQHLDALTAEDDARPVAVRLGAPAAYAAELRSAAGLPARSTRTSRVGFRERLARVPVAPARREVLRLLGELRPAWWVLRGYLVVLVPCLVEMDGVSDFPVPAPADSHVLGVLLVIAAVAASVTLGRRQLPRPLRVVVGALGVVVVFSAFVAWDRSDVSRGPGVGAASAVEAAVGEYPLLSRYGPVTDVFPYAADGTPLEGVLLYDQDGRPLKVGFQEWWADNCARVLDQPLAADGVPVPNSFPQAYVLHPSGVSVDGPLLPAGTTCDVDVARPDVPMPEFPADESAAPAPGD
jgi:hypothetical protein